MKTTVMFVADSMPLGGVPVRLAEGESEDVYVTDGEGKIEIDLDLGTHTFQVQVDDEWIERTVHRQGHAPLFVVNVQQDHARSMATLNTLQIDLANLVGDRYVFETVLGRGGMGVVVKAVDRMLNRPVAIKMLSDELRENEEAQQIFLVEARNLATLSHPNLVAIHDILNVGGRVLMVFEYVLGENVEKMIKKQGRLGAKEVLKIAIQLTRCVTYLHEHELIHRDLKPANIIIQSDGTLKLIDFGLARSLNELYVRGTRVRGTPAYMAPEQIQGIHLTTATDIYQLGISMYEMLVGKLPYPTGDMAYAHVHLDAPPLTEAVEGMDDELARLVHACLEKQPKNRPASAELLLEQLQQIYARLAAGDSQAFAAFDRSYSGPLPQVLTVPAEEPPQLGHVSSAADDIEVVPFDELSLAEEVVGGSNRGLAILGVIGLSALLVAGWLLMKPRAESADAAEAAQVENAAGVVESETETEPVVDEESERDPREDRTVSAARGLVGLGVATAAGRLNAVAEQAVEQQEPPRARPRTSKRRPKARAPVTRPPPVERQTNEPVAPVAAAETKPKPKTEPKKKKADEPPKSGLLSVDGKASKSLLPVSN